MGAGQDAENGDFRAIILDFPSFSVDFLNSRLTRPRGRGPKMTHRGRKNRFDRMFGDVEQPAPEKFEMPPGWPKRWKPRALTWAESEQVRRTGRFTPPPSQKRS